MNIVQKIAVMIVTGVPAIIGGGIIYQLTDHTYTLVAVYEVLLIAIMSFVAIKVVD